MATLAPPSAVPQVAILLAIAGGLMTIGVLRDAGVVNIALPENRRQVPQSIVGMPSSVGALQFGFELGTGVRTYLPGTAPYLVVAWAILAGASFGFPIVAGLGFGLGRWLILLDRDLSSTTDLWDKRLTDSARFLALLGSALVGVVLLISSLVQV